MHSAAQQERVRVNICEEEFVLLAQRAVYWPSKHTLIVADLHLGKSAHFRKNGLNVPSDVFNADLEILEHLIAENAVKRVLVLGDMFHAGMNEEFDQFMEWRKSVSCEWILIKGNHDRLENDVYAALGITAVKDCLTENNFCFTHFPADEERLSDEGKYNFCGHIHPSVMVSRYRLSAFIFGEQQAILPAFGKFTGTETITPGKSDRVFVIADDVVLEVRG